MDLKAASVLARNVFKERWFVVFICFLIMSLAGGTYIFGIYSDSGINQYATANWSSETLVHSSHATSVYHVEKYGAEGDGEHDPTEVDGMIDPPQNSESRKNTNKWLQFTKLERFTLRGRVLIDEQGEKLWAEQYKWVNQQRSVAAIEGRILVEPPEPKGHTGHGSHHH